MKPLIITVALAGLLAAGPASFTHATSVTLDDFETTSSVTNNNITSVSIVNDGTREVMQGTSTTADPQIVLGSILSGMHATFDTNVFTQVQFTLYVDSSVTSNVVIYYGTVASPALSATKSVTVDTSAYRGQYHTYTVDLSAAPSWKGSQLTTLRIDPFSETGKTFKIDSIALLSTSGDFSTVQPVPMNILWRVNVGGRDRMTTVQTTERDNYPCDGQIFYAPASNSGLTGLSTLTRFYDGTSPTDHRDSLLSSLSGYSANAPVGFPWPAVHTGLTPIKEAASSANQDFATVNLDYDSLLDSGTGYTLNTTTNGYAYERFDNSYNGVSLTSLTAGGVTASSNAVAGGAIWQWTWNGMQFVNDYDYGRQMQTSCFFPYTYNGTAMGTNPTEAGSNAAGAAGGSGQNIYGSVNLSLFNIGNTQVSRSIPVEWNTPMFGGNTTTSPVVWPGLSVGKDVTLNYRGMNHVAKYRTTWHTSATLTPSSVSPVQIEVPTVYLRGNFNTYYTYDAAANSGAGQLTAKTIPGYPASGYHIGALVNYGGVIATTSDSNFAMGFYGVAASQGGSLTDLTIWNFTTLGGTGQFDGGTTKLGTVWFQTTGTFAAGDHMFTSYVVTGTLSDVTSAMHTLYTLRGTIPQ